MARYVWLLVEWVDERNVFPSYGVVNVDTQTYSETDLCIGKEIFLSVKHENPRRAQILRISDSKRYVKEHKDILERQDQKIKNVIQLCMRTIKEMKTEPVYLTSLDQQHIPGGQNTVPRVVAANSDNSDGDSDPETRIYPEQSRVQQLNKNVKYNNHNNVEPNIRNSCSVYNSPNRRSIISSTPLPRSSAQDNVILHFDQGTQTDNTFVQPSIDKIEEMEAALKSLYRRFQSLVTQVNVGDHETMYVSDTEHNDGDISYIEPILNEFWVERNGVQYVGPEPIVNASMVEVGANQPNGDAVVEQQMNSSNSKIETDRDKGNTVRVRRMSAQTTNNIEPGKSNDGDMVSFLNVMECRDKEDHLKYGRQVEKCPAVPIGTGNANVPARVLNEITWTSYTTATRQLLQAIFPRRVLATHSLTGKQSPAFMNKPPKKILDPKLVADIVMTVASRCGVPKNLVRNSITTKCTDEAKLYRNRQYRHAHQSSRQNEENIPPSVLSSDECSTVTN